MQLTFLGKVSDHGDSPTLYATDRDSYLIQGWRVTDPEILTKVDVGQTEAVVEIYARLMPHLSKDGLTGIVMSWNPPVVHVKDNGNLIIQGERVSDPAAMAEMAVPHHEDVVEVSKAAVRALMKS